MSRLAAGTELLYELLERYQIKYLRGTSQKPDNRLSYGAAPLKSVFGLFI